MARTADPDYAISGKKRAKVFKDFEARLYARIAIVHSRCQKTANISRYRFKPPAHCWREPITPIEAIPFLGVGVDHLHNSSTAPNERLF